MRLPGAPVGAAAWPQPPVLCRGARPPSRRREVRADKHREMERAPRPVPSLYDIVSLQRDTPIHLVETGVGHRQLTVKRGATGQVMELAGQDRNGHPTSASVEIFDPHYRVGVTIDSIEIVRRTGWTRD